MLDRSIPFYNVILRCDDCNCDDIALPEGYYFSRFKEGYEKAWAKLEFDVGDFDSEKEAETYFVANYMQDKDQLMKRVLFLLDKEDCVVGSCIAWEDMRQNEKVSSLHWLIIDEQHQGKGLGKALCVETMKIFREKGEYPVYIHTQPWSWKAICLYSSLGFKIQKNDTFSHYENQYEQAMKVLQRVVDKKTFELLLELSEQKQEFKGSEDEYYWQTSGSNY